MTIRILKITDGKPGHITVSDGTIEAIRKNHTVEIIELKVQLRVKFFSNFLKFIFINDWLFKKIILHDWIINFFYKYYKKPNQQVDLIVSTGGDTSFINIWLSNSLNIKNIFCSSLRGLKSEHFFLVITTLESRFKNSIKLELAPTKIGSHNIVNDITKFCDENKIAKNKKYFVLLIGGDGAGYKYTKSDYGDLVKNFMNLVVKNNAKGLITTSRRTGAENEMFLEHLFTECDKHISYSVYFNKKPEKVVAIYLELASAIFVTEESGSMITESLFHKKSVFALYPLQVKEQKRYKLFLDDLRNKKRIKSLSIKKGLADCNINESDFIYLEKDPIEDLAEKIQPFLKEITS